MGKKDIIKVDTERELNLDIIGYVDPGATVNVIRDGKLVEKKTIDMPEVLTDVIFCKNPRCITSVEQELSHVFRLTDKQKKVYRCLYCETQAKQ
jgi:aspartate carbamoyltransferase regulatory subunit